MAAASLPMFDDVPRKLTIDDRFGEWVAKNPHVVRLYLRFAREARSKRAHYSVKAITERVRWEVNIHLTTEDEFRINDHFSAPMARLLINIDPSLRGLFALRKRTA